jgi:hypothetical protein
MRFPTPYIPTENGKPARLRDVLIPLGMAGVINLAGILTLHFSSAHGAENILRESGYTAIDIQEGPSLRRDDCNALYLTHFKATDRNGVRREGAVCHPAFGGEAKFLSSKLEP